MLGLLQQIATVVVEVAVDEEDAAVRLLGLPLARDGEGGVDGVADAGPIYTSNTEIVSLTEPLKVSLLGVDAGQPGMPEIVEGREFRGGEARETVIDRNVALRSDVKVGDEIELRSTQGTEDEFFKLKVVGLVDGQSYSFQPTIFGGAGGGAGAGATSGSTFFATKPQRGQRRFSSSCVAHPGQ